MWIIVELLVLAVVCAGVEVVLLSKIKNKELLYTLAFAIGMSMGVAVFFIFKINGN